MHSLKRTAPRRPLRPLIVIIVHAERRREGGNAVGSNSYLIVAECFDLRGNERTKRDLRAIRGEEEEEPAAEQRKGGQPASVGKEWGCVTSLCSSNDRRN